MFMSNDKQVLHTWHCGKYSPRSLTAIRRWNSTRGHCPTWADNSWLCTAMKWLHCCSKYVTVYTFLEKAGQRDLLGKQQLTRAKSSMRALGQLNMNHTFIFFHSAAGRNQHKYGNHLQRLGQQKAIKTGLKVITIFHNEHFCFLDFHKTPYAAWKYKETRKQNYMSSTIITSFLTTLRTSLSSRVRISWLLFTFNVTSTNSGL